MSRWGDRGNPVANMAEWYQALEWVLVYQDDDRATLTKGGLECIVTRDGSRGVTVKWENTPGR